MANGELLSEMQKILQGENTIPQAATNRMILAALVEVYTKIGELSDCVSALEDKIATLENGQKSTITWDLVGKGSIKNAIAIALMLLSALVGAVLAKLIK